MTSQINLTFSLVVDIKFLDLLLKKILAIYNVNQLFFWLNESTVLLYLV